MSNTYYYIPNVWGTPNIDHAYEFKSDHDIAAVNGGYDEFELLWLVEDMAKDFFHNHDGWEIANYWHGESRDFSVWDSDETFIGIIEVVLEYEPTFTAWRKK